MSYNKRTAKLKWSDDEKRVLIKHSKEKPLSELAAMLNRTEDQVKRMCSRLGCGYFTN